jgi:flagellar motor protein MotB
MRRLFVDPASGPKAGLPSTSWAIRTTRARSKAISRSRRRAQAVVDALVKNHKVDAKRLAEAGVANYAPLASNAGDAGRARNRRVELVLQ